MSKLFRISTVPLSLNVLLKGQLEFLDQHFDVTAISGSGPDLDEVVEREKVKVKAIPMKRHVSLHHDLVSLWKLYRYFKKEKPDIIHSITPKAGLLSMVAGKMAGVPIRMHTFTGLVFPVKTGWFKQLLIQMDRLLCVCATNVYPEGNGVKQELRYYKITDKPLKVIANGNVNGVNLDFFNPDFFSPEENATLRKTLNISDTDFVFVFIGRLVVDKGLVELIKAFQEISKKYERAKLLLVGMYEPDLDPLPKATLKEIKKHPKIIEVGFQKDVRPYFAISDVEILASYKEGFPNVILQAGAMGVPCIVTDISGNNEIISNGENGWVIPAKNPAALTKAMEESMAQTSELRKQYSENAKKNIEKHYRNDFVWNAFLKEYKNLLTH